jgi:cold shock protein
MSQQQQKGIVKFFNQEKGFGFITPDSGGKELFFHTSQFNGDNKSLREGFKVVYEKGEGRKGPEATNVNPA